jgi:hypothetical protein
MRYPAIVLAGVLAAAAPASHGQFTIGFSAPGISIGINVPVYPELVPVPGYPVYYAPDMGTNYFFYDGLYWVYDGTAWYSSTWYNGPWAIVDPYDVPYFILRIPVRYYRVPPPFFRGWVYDAPPRWGERFGHEWAERHRDWDRWNRRAVPPPAPLPSYQRQFSGGNYPRALEQQHAIRSQNYRYEPRESIAQRHFATPASGDRARPPGSPMGRPDARPYEQPRDVAAPRPDARPYEQPRSSQPTPAPAPRPDTRPYEQPRYAQPAPPPAPRPESRPYEAPRPPVAPPPAERPHEMRPAPEARPQPQPQAQRPQAAPQKNERERNERPEPR